MVDVFRVTQDEFDRFVSGWQEEETPKILRRKAKTSEFFVLEVVDPFTEKTDNLCLVKMECGETKPYGKNSVRGIVTTYRFKILWSSKELRYDSFN